VEANTTINEVKEGEDFGACVDGGLIELDEKDKNTMPKTQSLKENVTNEEEEGLESATPRTKRGSNDVNNKPKEVGST
jgi:hypothetical protein